MKKAVFPGSFDPFTIGHADIVRRAMPLFDEIIIAVGINHQKQPTFPLEQRLEMIRKAFADTDKVHVMSYDTLTADFAAEQGAEYIIRGIRSVQDFEYERAMADANKQLSGGKLETVIFYTDPRYAHISSSLVRDLCFHKKDITPYIV